jgi:hypothetical protein
MTPTAVGLVLVEGHGAEGEIMDQAAFDVPTRRGATAISTSEYVAGAMSRTRAMANGHRPHAIGVTWSDDSELEASLLLKSLTDAGFDNIVAVRSPEAGEALARGIGRAVGYQQTAFCLLEPESAVVSIVDTHDGAVETVAHHDHDTDAGLIDWLSDVFAVNGWHSECLIVVGPDADLTALATRLEKALGLPVFAPPEAELALARGAALASAHGPHFTHGGHGLSGTGHRARTRSRPLPYTAGLTMLAVGVVAFVVSASLVAALELTSNSVPHTTTAQQSAAAPPTPPVVAQIAAPPAAPPAATRRLEAAPPPEAAPVLSAAPSPTPPVETPVTSAEEASAGQPEQSPDGVAAPAQEAAPAPDGVPPVNAPPPGAPTAPPAPGEKPPLLTRILSHIPGLHRDPQPPADSSTPPSDASSAPAGAVPPDGPPPSP